jgi:hypothetical protein
MLCNTNSAAGLTYLCGKGSYNPARGVFLSSNQVATQIFLIIYKRLKVLVGLVAGERFKTNFLRFSLNLDVEDFVVKIAA